MADNIKIGFAVLLVIAGLAGFYWFSQSPLIARVGMVVAGLAAAAAVAWFSAPGREFVAFARESVAEVKKVVWPTRKESMQSAAAVFAFVVVMAVFLWIVDKGLEWALYDLILGWKR
ncbi:MAG: preprotein translocase subunit SecE [Burkholderiales bacterium]|nr:preprotein translocase subunit SecE [Burkholderiales bacterium]